MNEKLTDLLKPLNNQQKKIVESSSNMLVTACPGSGKTRVLTHKIAYTALTNEHSRKKIVAITFTNRAAEEIKDRLELLDIDNPAIWAGTIHQFCMEYIIRPYAMSIPQLCRGFKIVDEYVREEYIKQICEFMGIRIQHYERQEIKTALSIDMEVIEKNYVAVV